MHLSLSRRRAWWLVIAAAALATGTALTAGAVPAKATAAVNVTVNADEGLGTVPGTAYGLNQAVWDGQMNTPFSVSMLKPGGRRDDALPGRLLR